MLNDFRKKISVARWWNDTDRRKPTVLTAKPFPLPPFEPQI